MHIMLTILSVVALVGCVWTCIACANYGDLALKHYLKACDVAAALRSERDRVTVSERELDALRRELRKLSGKFYASLRETDDEPPPVEQDQHHLLPAALFCENYGIAQREGPRSDAAKCECAYCAEMRARRELFRKEAVPRTVQGQAELAKLNAGKP